MGFDSRHGRDFSPLHALPGNKAAGGGVGGEADMSPPSRAEVKNI